MIGEVVVGQRVDERAHARLLDHRDHRRDRCAQEMHLILRDRMRADGRVDHRIEEQDRWVAPENLTQRRGGGVVFGAVIDMRKDERRVGKAWGRTYSTRWATVY